MMLMISYSPRSPLILSTPIPSLFLLVCLWLIRTVSCGAVWRLFVEFSECFFCFINGIRVTYIEPQVRAIVSLEKTSRLESDKDNNFLGDLFLCSPCSIHVLCVEQVNELSKGNVTLIFIGIVAFTIQYISSSEILVFNPIAVVFGQQRMRSDEIFQLRLLILLPLNARPR